MIFETEIGHNRMKRLNVLINYDCLSSGSGSGSGSHSTFDPLHDVCQLLCVLVKQLDLCPQLLRDLFTCSLVFLVFVDKPIVQSVMCVRSRLSKWMY
jgi:hypothetical protein